MIVPFICIIVSFILVIWGISDFVVIDGMLEQIVEQATRNEAQTCPKVIGITLVFEIYYSKVSLLAQIIHASRIMQEIVQQFLNVK